MTYRVVHCGTGEAGRHGLRGVINHPDLELVGLYVNTPSKIGADAGDLCGAPKTGILGTNDIEAIVNLKADCMSYMAEGLARAEGAIDDIVRFLESGTDVVTCSLLHHTNPATAPEPAASRLREACERGGSTLYCTGGDPGVCTWQMAAMLLSAAGQVNQVRIQALWDYNHYENEWLLREVMGYGQEPNFDAPLLRPEARLQDYFTGYMYWLAESLGAKVDEMVLTHERAVTDRPIETTIGTINAGLVAAVRYEVTAMVEGHPLIVYEHIARLADDIGPGWAAPVPGYHAYRVAVDGSPPLLVEWLFDRSDPEGDLGQEAVTALHPVNAIPSVVAARSGHLSWADLGPYTTRNVRLAPRPIPDQPPRWPGQLKPAGWSAR